MPLLDDVATHLAGDGLGLTTGTNLFKGTMPEHPDASVALLEYGGFPATVGLGETGGIQREAASMQVLVRGAEFDYQTARSLAESCMNSLVKKQATALSGTNYWLFQPQQSPFFLKTDEQGRPHIAVNILVIKERG